LLVQIVFPVVLSSAAIPAPGPPGVTISRLPSTSGDSLISQLMLLPPNSLRTLRCQTTLPSAARRHARSPISVST
jgi:hypothetical protein